MRNIHEDEMEDYREQEREERYEKARQRKIADEAWRARMDPGYVPSWEREKND